MTFKFSFFYFIIFFLLLFFYIYNNYFVYSLKDLKLSKKSPLFDNIINNKKYNVEKLNLCLVAAAFTVKGGIENWLYSFTNLVKNDFNLVGTYIYGPKSESLFELIEKNKMFILKNGHDIIEYCDVVVSTAYFPVPNLINVMIIHGGSNNDWTNRYVSEYNYYDFIVNVSNDTSKELKNNRNDLKIIPAALIENKNNCTGEYKFCENQFLFVGRISSEKRPQLFTDFICNKKNKNCGVMIGPQYYDLLDIKTCENLIRYDSRNDVECFMKESKFLLVPSEEEGGPIVALEAFRNNLPVIMKETGLAKTYPEAFFIYNWDKYNYDDLNFFLKKITLSEYKKKIEKIFEIFITEFDDNIIKTKWLQIIHEIYNYANKTFIYNFKTKTKGCWFERMGKQQKCLCTSNEKCQFTLFFEDIFKDKKCFFEFIGINKPIQILKNNNEQIDFYFKGNNFNYYIDKNIKNITFYFSRGELILKNISITNT